MKRLFLALPLSDGAAEELWRSWEPLRFSSPAVRWIPPEQFHLTLEFLGETPEHLIPDILDIMEETGRLYAPIPILTGEAGQFPPGGVPRVLFASLTEGKNRTGKLRNRLHRRLSGLVRTEKRKFHPHITLARLRPGELMPPGYAPGVPLPPVRDLLEEMVLYESRLSPAGAVYHELHSTLLRRETERTDL